MRMRIEDGSEPMRMKRKKDQMNGVINRALYPHVRLHDRDRRRVCCCGRNPLRSIGKSQYHSESTSVHEAR